MRRIFNEILRQNEFTLEAWKKVKMKVLHKKGNVENVGNCRPICSLLASYKLFSTILYGRLFPGLDQEQAEDQAGFRCTCQAMDHLATCRLIEQNCYEWCLKMWIATVDFTKAFDSFTHKSIWKAVDSCGINHEYLPERHQDHDCLTNLRFADDVLLFATSKEQLQKMMYEFKESTKKVGLRIHPGKTKVLSNQSSISPDSKKRNANRRCQI